MIYLIKKIIRNYPNLKSFLKSPLNWFYAAYLTLRFVDEYLFFPAFQIKGLVKIKINKGKNSKLVIKNKIILEQWLYGDGCISLILGVNAKCIVENDFTVGQGTKLYVGPQAELILKGKISETASGITANSVVMVNEYLEIGTDSIIAWDTFITDCDWHGIDGKKSSKRTIIGEHTWIGVGAKILKGANINKNSIVTSLSVVLSGEYTESSLICGSPAKVIKTNIPHWHREMFDNNSTS